MKVEFKETDDYDKTTSIRKYMKNWTDVIKNNQQSPASTDMTVIVISGRVAKMSKRRQKIAITKGKCKTTTLKNCYPVNVGETTNAPDGQPVVEVTMSYDNPVLADMPFGSSVVIPVKANPETPQRKPIRGLSQPVGKIDDAWK